MNSVHQRVDRAMQAIGGDLVLETPPDLFDWVAPLPAVGRQVEQLDARMLPQPRRDRVRFMDAGVVEHEEQRLGGGLYQDTATHANTREHTRRLLARIELAAWLAGAVPCRVVRGLAVRATGPGDPRDHLGQPRPISAHACSRIGYSEGGGLAEACALLGTILRPLAQPPPCL